MNPAPKAAPSPFQSGLVGACPRCGSTTLFRNWVNFADRCTDCGLRFDSFNVGDGPAAFLIFIVGAITVVGALLVDGAFSPPWWVHLIWIPVAAGLTVGGLRLAKGWLLAQEYRHRAREGQIVE